MSRASCFTLNPDTLVPHMWPFPQNSAGPWRPEAISRPALGRHSTCDRTRPAQQSLLPHWPESSRLHGAHLEPATAQSLTTWRESLGSSNLGYPRGLVLICRDSQGQSVTHRLCLFWRRPGGVQFFWVPWLPSSELWIPISETGQSYDL